MIGDGTITAHIADTEQGISVTITVAAHVPSERMDSIAQSVIASIWGDRPDLLLKLQNKLSSAGGEE